jgi:hypothetical protein
MKQLILIPAILCICLCRAQNLALPYDSVTGRINYKQITELAPSPQDRIFSNAWRWLEKKYSPAVDSILTIDKASGHIVVKATLTEALTLAGTEHKAYLQHLLTIDAKDNKCRIQVSDLKFKEYFEATEFSNAGWKEVPIEGIVLGLMNDRFGGENSKAYKKFLIAEDVSIKAILDSFDEFLLQADAAKAANN